MISIGEEIIFINYTHLQIKNTKFMNYLTFFPPQCKQFSLISFCI